MIKNVKKQGPLIREIIYDHLVEDIIQGRVNAGEKLSEVALCEKFGVSKSPIREALLLMEMAGYIRLKKNVGAFVLKLSEKVIEEGYTIIAVLESYAAEKVVIEGRIQKYELNELSNLIKKMEECSKKRKYLDFRPLNLKFHGIFMEKLGNDMLRNKVIQLRRRMYTPVTAGLALAIHINQYIEWHKRILEAVKHDNGHKAASFMRDHVMGAKQFLLETLREHELQHRESPSGTLGNVSSISN